MIDLCSRKVVSWSMSSRMKAQLICDALTMAIWHRRPKSGLIHHSDPGFTICQQSVQMTTEGSGGLFP
ncbi:MAG: DDE-type integrase/transposase/recombinase [Candidatus Thiodiazotropha sp. (ex Lucinoma aequizonata)]|nr:DDE-type integrase/transposase/recombinase [Candidatus Thiodiazotropha sp. (ex Lucinoma aequizonata)]